MKKIRTRLTAVLLLVSVLVFAGCSSSGTFENEQYYQERSDRYALMLSGYDEEALNAVVDSIRADYDSFEQQIELYPYLEGNGEKFEFTADAYLSLFKSYAENLSELGSYVGLKEYEGGNVSSDGSVSYSVVYEFTEHDMRMSLEYDSFGVVTTVTIDPIYSLSEIAQKAVLNTIIGMGTVFIMLILLCFVISRFKYIAILQEKWNNRKEKKNADISGTRAEEPPVVETSALAVETPAPPETAAADDLQLIAVITAAVAAETGTSPDGFVVRSIRRKNTGKWKKA